MTNARSSRSSTAKSGTPTNSAKTSKSRGLELHSVPYDEKVTDSGEASNSNTTPGSTTTSFPADPWPGKISGIVVKSYVPYMGVQFDRPLIFPGIPLEFRVFTYQAHNALGLIGPEFNGVAVVLDKPSKTVICDRIENAQTGYFGVSKQAWDMAHELCRMAWPEFVEFINNHPRSRVKLSAHPSGRHDVETRRSR